MGMQNVSDVYAVSFLNSWFQKNHKLFDRHSVVSEYMDTGNGSALVRLTSARYLAEICVWDHASCIDIQILDVSSEKSTFPHVGECKDRLELEAELNKFIEWFEDEARIGN